MASSTVIRDTEHFAVDETALQNLRASIRGKIISAEDSSYNEERSVYNGMIDKYPSLIVKCRDVADVMAALAFAKSSKLAIAIRGGGHNAAGSGVCDNGLVIDLGLMKGMHIDVKDNTIRVEGGCLLGDIDHVTQAFGMAVPSGILSTTGITGLTLGGGLGHLSRAYGLSIDSLIEADIVLADGQLVTASEKTNSDLFWAIRGGGGNFGVIVSFLFRMHKAGIVYGGPMLWHLKDSETMLQYYRDFILKAPNDVYGYFAFLTVPPVPLFPQELHLKKMCGIVWCNLGEKEKAKKSVDLFRNFKKPALDYTGEIPFSALQGMFDALYPKGLQWYWKADFVKELSDEAIKLNVKYAEKLPSPHSTVHLYPINGEVHRKKGEDTAFAFRDANWSQVIVGVDPDPAKREVLTSWAKAYWEALHPFSAGGAYINFMMDEGTDRVKASYGENYERLVRIKSKYDPQNIFSVNQNIKPR
jgi:FAD/FMN-containing dehydrogenase